MKAKILSCLMFSCGLVYAQTEAAADPFADPALLSVANKIIIPSVKTGDSSRISDLLDGAKNQSVEGKKMNVVYKDGAEKVMVPPLNLRNVNFMSLLEVLQEMVGVDFVIIGNPGQEIIVISPPQAPAKVSRGVQVKGGARAGGRAVVKKTTNDEPIMQVFGTASLGVDRKVLEDAILSVWDISEPDWKAAPSAKLFIHPETRMLIVKAKQARINEVTRIIETIAVDQFQQKKDKVKQLTDRLKKVEADFHETLDLKEERYKTELKMLERESAELRHKIRNLEARLREAKATKK